MVREYKKGSSAFLTEHFSSNEFDCHCTRPECQVTLIDEDLPGALEMLRSESGGPIHIDSGYRCPAHNEEVGGAKDSQHPKGTAADCKSLIGHSGSAMARYAEMVLEFQRGGIGIYPSFAHCDVRKSGPARWHSIPC